MAQKLSHKLNRNIHLTCYSCKSKEASHTCQFEWDGVSYQLCLCNECLGLSDKQLCSEFLFSL